jgi:non-specific protein-tyrosine kinase
LRTNIQFASVDKPIESLLITSIAPEEGKTTIAANLSIALAQGGRNVICIDGDLRKPKMHRMMRLPNRKGLTTMFMQPEIQLDGTIQKTDTNNLYIMTAGNLPPNPSELLASDRMDYIIDTMIEHADIVVIDTPPIMAVTDAVVLSQRVDGVLLIIKVGETRTTAAQQTVDQLRRLNANILGVVLNNVPTRGSRYYYSNGYYTYQEYYGKSEGKPRKGIFPLRKFRR